MSDEKKTRQRLTMTAMREAIEDIFRIVDSTAPNFDTIELRISSSKGPEQQTIYNCSLWKMRTIDAPNDVMFVTDATSEEGIEEATAALLGKLRERFEEHRKKLLGGLDSVLERHHGALRGARSKIREKKA